MFFSVQPNGIDLLPASVTLVYVLENMLGEKSVVKTVG